MLDLCEPCHKQLPILSHFCRYCAGSLGEKGYTQANKSMALSLIMLETQDVICESCRNTPPPFDITHALFSYEDSIKRLILNLKFQQDLKIARILGELLTAKIQREWYRDLPLPSIIIPMPLHAKRLKKRGFNQALEIAKPVSKILRLPIDITSCKRTKYTEPQAMLSAQERIKNVNNAFEIVTDFSHQHVVILDDVITTGHTVTALASALKAAGASKIDVWCCARAVMKKHLLTNQ